MLNGWYRGWLGIWWYADKYTSWLRLKTSGQQRWQPGWEVGRRPGLALRDGEDGKYGSNSTGSLYSTSHPNQSPSISFSPFFFILGFLRSGAGEIINNKLRKDRVARLRARLRSDESDPMFLQTDPQMRDRSFPIWSTCSFSVLPSAHPNRPIPHSLIRLRDSPSLSAGPACALVLVLAVARP